jgi:protein-S-isoprenylcysteine O-methyltransferase Ste14
MLPVFAFNHIDFMILSMTYVLWIASEIVWTRSRRPAREAQRNDRYSGLVLMLCLWVGVSAAFVAAFADPQFAIRPVRPLLFGLGVALMLAGMALRWYSIFVLGRYFTVVVAIQPGHTVVERGPYRFVRHPSYSGTLLTILGLGLALTNWVSVIAAVLLTALGYSYRIAVEERTLLAALGEPYRQYMKRTKRIIPFVI